MVSTRPSLDGVYLWDELAAVATVHPELVTFEETPLGIDDDGALAVLADGATVRVAVRADADAIVEEFLRTLNDGSLPEVAPASAAETQYLVALSGASSNFVAAVGDAYALASGPDLDNDARAAAHTFAAQLFGAIDALEAEVRSATPPAELRSAHDAHLAAIVALADRREAVVAEIHAAAVTDPGQLLEAAFSAAAVDGAIAEFNATCTALQDWSFLRDGPRVCPPDGE